MKATGGTKERASARTGTLMTREDEPTAGRSAVVVLDTTRRDGLEGQVEEALVSHAATVLDSLGRNGWEVRIVDASGDEITVGITAHASEQLGDVVFIELPNTKIELLYPLGEDSPIKGFLDKNPSGGIHHMCFEVEDILAARDTLKAQGARVLGTGEPKIGAHGKPVLFLHPKDFNGCLIELEQV